MQIPHLDLKGEILLQILDNHNKEGKLDAQCLLGVCRTCYVGGTAKTRETDKGDYMQPSCVFPGCHSQPRFNGTTRYYDSDNRAGWRRRPRFNEFPRAEESVKQTQTHLTFAPSTSNTCEWMSLSMTLLM